MKRAVIMSRVSSDEQAKGYSLDVQFEQLTKYCERNDIEVVKHYREDHSAMNFNRPEFQKFLQYAALHKSEIDYLFVTSWDRFSRNMTEANLMLRKLSALEIEVQAIEQPIDFSVPENKAMLALYLILPEIDNDRRSIKIRGGIRGSLKAGRWCRKAPVGYRNSRDIDNKPLIVPNENAQFIRHAYHSILMNKSQSEAMAEIKNMGYRISRNNMSLILRNPVYMGKIVVPKNEEEPDLLLEGVHEGLVTEEQFYKVQEILNKRRNKKSLPIYNSKREELPLRGIIYCSKCEEKLTGSPSRSQNGKRYFYYHCNHCRKERISAMRVNKTIESILEDFKFTHEAQLIYETMVKELLSGDEQQTNNKREKLKKQIEEVKMRIENLQDLLVDMKIDTESYAKANSRYSAKLSELKQQLSEIQTTSSQYKTWLNKGVHMLKNLENHYVNSSVNQKQQLLSSIFPENLFFEENKCRTGRINEVMRLILQTDSMLANKKRGQISNKLNLSPLVEPEGVEPSSKQAITMLSSCLVFD